MPKFSSFHKVILNDVSIFLIDIFKRAVLSFPKFKAFDVPLNFENV